MSDSVSIKVALASLSAIMKTCEDMRGEIASTDFSVQSRRIFDDTYRDGIAIKFKSWQFHVVIADGEVMYDNYKGLWGDIATLNKFLRNYTANAAIELAQREGDTVVSDTTNDDARVIDIRKLNGNMVRITCTEQGAHAEVLGCTGTECLGSLNMFDSMGQSTHQLKPEFYEEQQERERLKEME